MCISYVVVMFDRNIVAINLSWLQSSCRCFSRYTSLWYHLCFNRCKPLVYHGLWVSIIVFLRHWSWLLVLLSSDMQVSIVTYNWFSGMEGLIRFDWNVSCVCCFNVVDELISSLHEPVHRNMIGSDSASQNCGQIKKVCFHQHGHCILTMNL